MKRNELTISSRCAAVSVLAMILVTTSVVQAKAPRYAKRAPARTVQVLERGVGMPLVTDAVRTRVDKRALREVFRGEEPVALNVGIEMLRPDDGVLTTMWETRSGFPLVMEIELGDVDMRARQLAVEIFPQTLDNLYVRNGNKVERIQKRTLAKVMTRSERETGYFCQRTDGHGGAIARGTIGVAVDGEFFEVPVALRRDAFQEAGMQVLASSRTPITGAKKASNKQKKVWVISWFSDDCKRTKKGRCPRKECKVPLSELIKLATQAGLDIPEGAVASEIIELLVDADIGFEGRCGKVEFIIPILGFLKKDCQCILYTFGGDPEAISGTQL